MMKVKQLIIIGGGKSINLGLQEGLKEQIANRFVIGCNLAFKFFETTLTCYVDHRFWRQYYDELSKLFLTISRTQASIEPANNLILLPVSNQYKGRHSFEQGIYSGYLTGMFALTIGIQLLKKGEIYLLGYDHRSSYDSNGNIDNNFHNDKSLIQRLDYNNDLNKANKLYNPFIKEKSIKIYNVSPESNIDVFEKIDYQTFFNKLDNNFINQIELRRNIRRQLNAK